MAPTYGLTAGYRNVAMAVPEPSLRQEIAPGKPFPAIGDHNDARRGSDPRWAVERECRSRPVHWDVRRKAGDCFHHVASRDDKPLKVSSDCPPDFQAEATSAQGGQRSASDVPTLSRSPVKRSQ